MIVNEYDVFFVDLDGVVHVGDRVVSTVPTVLERLREAGKTIRFLTNNSRSTKEELVDQLNRWGIEAEMDELITAGWATARHLAEKEADSTYVLGSDGLKEEISKKGVLVTDESEAELADAVTVGLDFDVDYDRLTNGVRALDNGADLIAANEDTVLPTETGIAPGTGAIVSALRAVTDSQPTVIGKPRQELFDIARADLDPDSRILVIGDSPDSDIEGAHRAGIDAALVTDSNPSSLSDVQTPEIVIQNLEELFDNGQH